MLLGGRGVGMRERERCGYLTKNRICKVEIASDVCKMKSDSAYAGNCKPN